MNLEGLKYLVVGSGFWGSVIAERIASVLGEKVLVIDKRDHIGGNCYSEVDPDTAIECHRYGTHGFHTDNRQVWDYLQGFGEFTNYQHKVFTSFKNVVYSMPINLGTINSYFDLNLNPAEAEAFIAEDIRRHAPARIDNLEDKAIALISSAQ